MTNAALVGIDFGAGDFQASLDELSFLARSAGATPPQQLQRAAECQTPPFSCQVAKQTSLSLWLNTRTLIW